MKILHVINGLGTGGIENYVINLLKNKPSNFRVDFLVTDLKIGHNESFIESLGSRIYHINNPKNVFKRLKARKKFFDSDEFDYDLVHIHAMFSTAYNFAKMAKKSGAKSIVHAHVAGAEGIRKAIHRLFVKKVNRYSDALLACSRNAADFMFGRYSKKALVARVGVDIESFKFNKTLRDRVRKELKLSDGDILLGTVGRLSIQKNHAFLLDVIKELDDDRFKLVIIGNGNRKEELEKKVEEYCLQTKVSILTEVEKTSDYLNAFDCFVFPSLYEGFPAVLIEAQANGLPILCSDNITEDINILSKVDYIPIDAVDKWTTLIKSADGYIRYDDVELLDKFDVKQTSWFIYSLYEAMEKG